MLPCIVAIRITATARHSMLRAAISIVLRIGPIELGSDSIDLLDVAVCSFGIAHRTRVRHPVVTMRGDLCGTGAERCFAGTA
jgi:hypothetical protein